MRFSLRTEISITMSGGGATLFEEYSRARQEIVGVSLGTLLRPPERQLPLLRRSHLRRGAHHRPDAPRRRGPTAAQAVVAPDLSGRPILLDAGHAQTGKTVPVD
jgi:hypothetical protein